MESPDNKEEKYDISQQNVKFFSTRKIFKLFISVFVGLFAIFGLLTLINLTVYPDMGIIELAQERTEQWRRAKQTDMAHEAIAFELMLDAYAKKGGDISHALDTLTDEFTAANWAELLEYDVDYFIKHDEVSDSIKTNGMLHLTKTMYTSGHYDLFKSAYKTLMNRFATPADYPVIYAELLPLEANFDFDDEVEEEELNRLYELELRRHLKMTAEAITEGINANNISASQMSVFVDKVNITFHDDAFLNARGDAFKEQLKTDLSTILPMVEEMAKSSDNEELANSVAGTYQFLQMNNFGLSQPETEE